MKNKLDGIAENANNYSHPTHDAATSGLYKVTVDSLGHVTAVTAVKKEDITGLGIPGQDTTYTHPNDGPSGGATSGLYKITVNAQGHVTACTNPTTLAGFGITDAKKKQSAKPSPSTSGNALAFIDTISQNEQGVITATKKNAQNATET